MTINKNMKAFCYANNSKSLFRKYAKLVTWFANTSMGREYLGLDFDQEIGLFLPNGYHKILDKKTRQATFFTRAIYSPKLYLSLLKLDLMLDRWQLSFEDQSAIILMDLGLRKYSFEYPRVFLTISTFNPDADPETTSVDGRVFRDGVNETWATIHDALDGTGAQDSLTAGQHTMVGASLTTNQWRELYRGFLLFDSSSLPDTANIDNANIQLYINSKVSTLGGTMEIVTSTPASNTALAAADYDQMGAVRQATGIAYASLTTGAYNTFNFNATGISNISKTGISKFGERHSNDVDNSPPTWSSGANTSDNSDWAEGTNKPKLVVEYNKIGGFPFMSY